MGSVFPLCSGSQVSLLFIVPDRLCRAGLCLCSTFICTKCSCCRHSLGEFRVFPCPIRTPPGCQLGHLLAKCYFCSHFPGRKPYSSQMRGGAALLPGGQNFATAFKSRQCENSRFPFLEKQTLACLGNNPQSFPAASMPGVGCVAVPALMNMKSRALPTAF